MSDKPDHWGCKDFPIVGEVCFSDFLDKGADVIKEKFVEIWGADDPRGPGPWKNPPGSNGTPNGNRLPDQTGYGSLMGCEVTVPIQQRSRAYVPAGYVVVNNPKTGQKIGMLKKVARSCGLWKPSRKPPIKASDWRCLMKADSVIKKLDRVVGAANNITGKPRFSRARTKRR